MNPKLYSQTTLSIDKILKCFCKINVIVLNLVQNTVLVLFETRTIYLMINRKMVTINLGICCQW